MKHRWKALGWLTLGSQTQNYLIYYTLLFPIIVPLVLFYYISLLPESRPSVTRPKPADCSASRLRSSKRRIWAPGHGMTRGVEAWHPPKPTLAMSEAPKLQGTRLRIQSSKAHCQDTSRYVKLRTEPEIFQGKQKTAPRSIENRTRKEVHFGSSG